MVQHPLNSYLESCYQHIFLKPNSDELSPLFVNSVKADKALNSYYYARPPEVCARAFEAVIQDHPLKNAFLVQGTKQSTEAKLGIYPEQQHRLLIAQCFHDYFATLGYAINKKG